MTFDEWLAENDYYAKDILLCQGASDEEIDELYEQFLDYCYENDIEARDDVDFHR